MSALDDYRSGTIIEFSDTLIETIPDEAIAASQAAARSAEKLYQQSSSSDTASGNVTTDISNGTNNGLYIEGYIKFNLDSTIEPLGKKIRIRVSMVNNIPRTTTQDLIFILKGKSSSDLKELNKTYSIPGSTDDALSKTLTFTIPNTWENTSKLTFTVKRLNSAVGLITFKIKKITLKDS